MDKYKEILRKYWGYPDFRPLQGDIIKSIGSRNDTLALLPTGGGKSICFQVPALAVDGLCLVVSPLIALMKDQVENLKKQNIKAIAIYTGMNKEQISIAFENCLHGNFKFLYLSPERLETELFMSYLEKLNISILAIDESHCISQWGYDFRPSYLRIANIREKLPEVPVIALTATATPKVVDDIQEKLLFKKQNALRKSFERKNLTYLVRPSDSKFTDLLRILRKIKTSGIVYVRSRKRTKEIAAYLLEHKISADFYHAGIDNRQKDIKQRQWKEGKIKIIVATNAFGMGIDKADVRIVVHMDLPDSLEAYFQEAGRGGRDEKRAYAIILYNKADINKLLKNFKKSFPPIKYILSVYNTLGNFFRIPVGIGKDETYRFDFFRFCKVYSFEFVECHSALKFLEKENYIKLSENVYSTSKLMIPISNRDLYKVQVSNPKLDFFIKGILRVYEGVFNDFVKISETKLANFLAVKIEKVKEALFLLNNLKVINYVPKNTSSYIFYTIERLEQGRIKISEENYNFLKQLQKERIDAMINYVESTNKCRSQLLLMYFGEEDPDRCGNCDVCIKKNEVEISKYEFDLILEKIKNIIKEEKEIKLDKLIKQTKRNEKKVIKVIDWLLDNDKLLKNEKEMFYWNK